MSENTYDALTCLSDEEMANFEPLTSDEIMQLLQDGEREREEFERICFSGRMPTGLYYR